MNLELFFNTIHKNKLEMIMDLIVMVKIIKPLEENIGINLHDPGLGKAFRDNDNKAQVTEEILNKLGLIKLTIFGAANYIIKKTKR